MSGIFPKGGVECDQAFQAQCGISNISPECRALFYAAKCNTRFDSSQQNAIISEIANAITKGCGADEYDCGRFDNLYIAIQRAIQFECAQFAKSSAGGVNPSSGRHQYVAELSPKLNRYIDGQVIHLIPNITNSAASEINIDGLGSRRIRRNDGSDVQRQDLRANTPITLIYYSNSWYVDGLSPSQVPIVATGTVTGWVRPDGNDLTGDGTANTPDKAFKTIKGAWEAIGGRYAASPQFRIVIRLGVPATYDGVSFGAYGGVVQLMGDADNPEQFIVRGIFYGRNSASIITTSVSELMLTGITLQNNNWSDDGFTTALIWNNGSTIYYNNCLFMFHSGKPLTTVYVGFNLSSGGANYIQQGCHARPVSSIGSVDIDRMFSMAEGAIFRGANAANPAVMPIQGLNVLSEFIYTTSAAQFNMHHLTMQPTNVTGKKATANLNSVIQYRGLPQPGTSNYTTSTGGQIVD